MNREGELEPQSSLRNSPWSQCYNIWKARNKEIYVFYLGEFLNSQCFILFVPCSFSVTRFWSRGEERILRIKIERSQRAVTRIISTI